MKDARSEAQKEIEDYRKQKDEEFKKFEAEVSWTTLLYGPEDKRTAAGADITTAFQWKQESGTRCGKGR